MNLRLSAAIRQHYNEIAELCRRTAEPVFLTKNGEGDLVVMDNEILSPQLPEDQILSHPATGWQYEYFPCRACHCSVNSYRRIRPVCR